MYGQYRQGFQEGWRAGRRAGLFLALLLLSPLLVAGLVSFGQRASPVVKNAAKRIRDNRWMMRMFDRDRWMIKQMEDSRELEGYYEFDGDINKN